MNHSAIERFPAGEGAYFLLDPICQLNIFCCFPEGIMFRASVYFEAEKNTWCGSSLFGRSAFSRLEGTSSVPSIRKWLNLRYIRKPAVL